MTPQVEVVGRPGTEGAVDGLAVAARLLHEFTIEYDDPSPGPDALARRLGDLVGAELAVLVARDPATQDGVGVAVLRVQPSVWSATCEAYLAELYVVPHRRGDGFGRALLAEALDVARARGAVYVFLVTSEEDTLARRAYEAAGFRDTEGEDGPRMVAYERDL